MELYIWFGCYVGMDIFQNKKQFVHFTMCKVYIGGGGGVKTHPDREIFLVLELFI